MEKENQDRKEFTPEERFARIQAKYKLTKRQKVAYIKWKEYGYACHAGYEIREHHWGLRHEDYPPVTRVTLVMSRERDGTIQYKDIEPDGTLKHSIYDYTFGYYKRT